MSKFLRTILELAGIGLIFFIFGNDGVVESHYTSWWESLNPGTKLQFPQSYRYLPQYTLIIIFVVGFVLLYRWLVSFGGVRRPHMPLEIPDFYAEISKFYELYFNDRLHELKKDTITNSLNSPLAHEKALVDTLYRIRRALMDGYRPANVRITLMAPQQINQQSRPKLFIQYWANDTRSTPQTLKLQIGFSKGDGFAGRAWQTGRAQIGGKRKLFIFPEPRR